MNQAKPVNKRMHRIDPRFLLLGVLAAALAARLAFFTGYFGSDEVTYTGEAVRLLAGEWPQSDYIGAVRLGITFPVALLMWIFGHTEFAANLWSLLCSLGEIALVFILAKHFWGTRAALLSSLLLAFTPLHAHYAGRLMADAPLAFFITLTFFSLLWGDRQEHRLWYFAAGIAAGMVWWIKSAVAPVFLTVFAIYVIREKRFAMKWLFMAAGVLLMFLINGLIFQVMENDFWKIYRMTTSGVAEYAGDRVQGSEPWFYIKYLFVDIKHTLLLGPLAAIATLLWIWPGNKNKHRGTKIFIWGVGLVAILSLFLVSLKPLLFITKQVNYMTVFLAPLALLSGYALSRLSNLWASLVAFIVISIGLLGTALEQLSIQSFVANSKAALVFAREHPDADVFAMTNAVRTANYELLFSTSPENVPRIYEINRLSQLSPVQSDAVNKRTAYVIFDRQTAGWGTQGPFSDEKNLPDCWLAVGSLQPQGMGIGVHIGRALTSLAPLVPASLGQALSSRLTGLLVPLPAVVYQVQPGCRQSS